MTAANLDRKLLDAFTSGKLDHSGEAALAEQVARLLPTHWMLPNSAAAALSKLTKHLDGPAALEAWLDGHPGRPRLVARTYRLIRLLDRLSNRRAVVTALAEMRAESGDPPPLRGYLMPATTAETLASLAQQIESMLADRPVEDVLQLALATVDLLQRLAPRLREPDPDLSGLDDEVAEIRRSLAETSIQEIAGR
ncbi:hypothetical protein [Virgisporangium aurantiacum]|uniref:Uncharacterized protein n=1 Tax=Virgisporangium aurantiacum TaxID=175570 RepID=A0A8J4E872_9ACTN|nr:hypothetical protein [Virgisporangium aurantiacum]GIJ64948.1 hypothetical protein Vau01_124640 [Virgisporangium aurantiacum]